MSVSTAQTSNLASLQIAPARVLRGENALVQAGGEIAQLGCRPLLVGGDRAMETISAQWQQVVEEYNLQTARISSHPDCSEPTLEKLYAAVRNHQADCIVGAGGGKALDAAKLLAHRHRLPIVTIPTSAATCAAWTALSNIYSDEGAFLYDVELARCPDLLVLDYDFIAKAPQKMLVAGIGDALAKWYEASVSSSHSTATLEIAAVQQARVLRDLLLQKSAPALENPGSSEWRETVDATVLLAGAIGGLGGAQCRTVAAHAIHNGLTHIRGDRPTLHGEKVAYGILVQLRLEETVQGNQLAATARRQLLKFYAEIGLPQTLEDLGLGQVSLAQLRRAAEIACAPNSDIHRLPFAVSSELAIAAMVSTTATESEGNAASLSLS
ncbi:MAG: iron-containing alcohol dehydrogenase family protein [Cyanobacteriota bacterium]|nr:iron-containing alcohol dehydrogenase family protein [Cyanobacteriota bacterium]